MKFLTQKSPIYEYDKLRMLHQWSEITSTPLLKAQYDLILKVYQKQGYDI